jgi:hypothetical protein
MATYFGDPGHKPSHPARVPDDIKGPEYIFYLIWLRKSFTDDEIIWANNLGALIPAIGPRSKWSLEDERKRQAVLDARPPSIRAFKHGAIQEAQRQAKREVRQDLQSRQTSAREERSRLITERKAAIQAERALARSRARESRREQRFYKPEPKPKLEPVVSPSFDDCPLDDFPEVPDNVAVALVKLALATYERGERFVTSEAFVNLFTAGHTRLGLDRVAA